MNFWLERVKCNIEKREIHCLCCLEVTALNEEFEMDVTSGDVIEETELPCNSI